jgi:hypothetical protein
MVPRASSPIDQRIDPACELRRLRNDVWKALAIKLVAIIALMLVFFGPSHRPSVDPETIFAPSKSPVQIHS